MHQQNTLIHHHIYCFPPWDCLKKGRLLLAEKRDTTLTSIHARTLAFGRRGSSSETNGDQDDTPAGQDDTLAFEEPSKAAALAFEEHSKAPAPVSARLPEVTKEASSKISSFNASRRTSKKALPAPSPAEFRKAAKSSKSSSFSFKKKITANGVAVLLQFTSEDCNEFIQMVQWLNPQLLVSNQTQGNAQRSSEVQIERGTICLGMESTSGIEIEQPLVYNNQRVDFTKVEGLNINFNAFRTKEESGIMVPRSSETAIQQRTWKATNLIVSAILDSAESTEQRVLTLIHHSLIHPKIRELAKSVEFQNENMKDRSYHSQQIKDFITLASKAEDIHG